MDLMAGLDVALLMAESLASPMHVGALLIFSPPADAGPHYTDDLHRQALLGAGEIDLRLRRRPRRGADTLGMWAWEQVVVDLPDHMQARVLPPGSDEQVLWDLISDLHARPLDRNRPQWMAYLIDGLPDGRFAFYIKIHHTLVDGAEGMQMLGDGMSTDASNRAVKPFYVVAEHAPADAEEESDSTGRPRAASALRSLADTGAAVTGLVGDLIGGSTDYLAGALKGDSPLPLSAPDTRFNGRLGKERAVGGGSWPLARVLAIQDAAEAAFGGRKGSEVTCNDVLTTVVSGALRGWLAAHDELPDRSLIAFCPISVRVEGEATQAHRGNQFGLQQCPLGTEIEDPVERLKTIHRSMLFAKEQVARHGLATALLAAPNLAPTFLLSLVPRIPKLRNGYNVPISNVRGPATDMYFNGAHLDSLFPISTVFDGMGLNITMCSYAGTVAFGYVAGRNLMPDVQTLVPLTDAAFAELEAAFGVGRG